VSFKSYILVFVFVKTTFSSLFNQADVLQARMPH